MPKSKPVPGRHSRTLTRVAIALIALLLTGIALGQQGAIQVFGEPGLVIRVDGNLVGVTNNDPSGLLIFDVRPGDRTIDALKEGLLVWSDTVRVERGGVTVVRPVDPWPLQFGTRGTDEAFDATVAPNGTILIAGTTTRSLGATYAGREDAFVRALDPQGNELWTHQYGTPQEETLWSVTVAPNGTILIAGETYVPIGTTNEEGIGRHSPEAYVRALDPQGQELWTHQHDTPEPGGASGVAVAPNGTILIVGFTNGSLGATNAGGTDAYVRALNPRGRELWTHQYGTPEEDAAAGVAIAPNGTILIAGFTYGSLGTTNAGGTDAYVRALNPRGRELWTHQYGTPEEDAAAGVAIAPNGTILTAGTTRGPLGTTDAGWGDAYVYRVPITLD